MTTPGAPYRDRIEAGRRLAEAIEAYRWRPVTVLALPRGGVPVASVVADRLGVPLDILVVRKVGAPGNREFGLGAVAEGGVRFLDQTLLEGLGLRPEDIEHEVRVQMEEVTRLARTFRGRRAPPVLEGRTVILVDDGMATGGTVRCAIQAVRLQRPSRVVVAVGVSSQEAVDALRPLVDEVVCPLIPRRLFAVGEWYREFPQVSDEEVSRLLARHWGPDSARIPTT
ncbi:MAG TPA: phosphoribosyltransferase [Thermoplasmata archaeon]|nr:phosphoribosyltransferase [Thermoplasmata archaeon]